MEAMRRRIGHRSSIQLELIELCVCLCLVAHVLRMPVISPTIFTLCTRNVGSTSSTLFTTILYKMTKWASERANEPGA